MGRSSRTDNCCGICSAVFECVRFNECTQPYTMWQHEEMYKATFTLWYVYRDVILGVEGPDPWKYVWGVRVCLTAYKMSHSFIQNCCWTTGQVSNHGWKTHVNFFWPWPPYFTTDLYAMGLYACIRISVRSAEIDPTVLLIMPYGKTNH